MAIVTNPNVTGVPVSGGGGGAVDSVNGKTGEVVLDATDVGALPDSTTYAATVNGLSGTVSLNTDAIPEGSSNKYLTLEALAPYVGGLNAWPQNTTATNAASYTISSTGARFIECHRIGAQTLVLPDDSSFSQNGSLWFIAKGGQYTGDVTVNEAPGGTLVHTIAPGGWAVIAHLGRNSGRWKVIASGV